MRAADQILAYYNGRLARHGDSAQGAGWPNEADRLRRFAVMLDVVRGVPGQASLCDLGCGTGELLTYLKRIGRDGLRYTGIDISAEALAIARRKHPEARFLELDLLEESSDDAPLEFDYVIASGLFTVRADATEDEMRAFWTAMVEKMWTIARVGIAFNVMSKLVDWERPDLFHVSFDDTAAVLQRLAGRNVVLRADYGLYEYTAYAYREEDARAPTLADPRETATRIVEPRLPDAGAIAPYLETLDASRWYSNFGPLVMAFSDRMSERFGLPARCAVPSSSGTTALVAGILAAAGTARPERPLALVPAYTFVATALAAEQCGYEVRIADVDERTWALDPRAVLERHDLDRIGLIVPVAPLGGVLPARGWRALSQETGIPVVLDAAASIEHYLDADSEELGAVPTVFSLHATKSFSTGEGGLLVSRDPALALDAARALHFGLSDDRVCEGFGINGKMSEYHAAVGLAELDGWDAKRRRLAECVETYEACFAAQQLDRFLRLPPDLASCYTLFCCHDAAEADALREQLARIHVHTRFWYRPVLSRHPHFSGSAEPAPVAEKLTAQLLGLPAGPALSVESIEKIALAIGRSLAPR